MTSSERQKEKLCEHQKSMQYLKIDNTKAVRENRDIPALFDVWQQSHDLTLVSDIAFQKIQDIAIINEGLRKTTEVHHSEGADENQKLDTSKLYVGQTIPNYKKLCELLSVRPTTGQAKQNQEAYFLRFFNYEKLKNSNKILIRDIYQEPLPPKETSRYRKSLYTNQLKILLLCELFEFCKDKNDIETINTSFSRLIYKLGLTNYYFFDKATEEFFVNKFEIEFSNKEIDTEKTKRKLRFFKSDAYGKIKNAITYSLNSLKKDKLITYKGFNVIVSLEGVHSKATPDDEIIIHRLKTEVAIELGFKNAHMAAIYKPEAFNRKLSKLYQALGWDYVYYQLQIIPLKDFQERIISSFTAYQDSRKVSELTDSDKAQYCNSFNENLCSELIEKLKKKKQKELEKWTEELRESEPEFTDDLTDDEIVEYLQLNNNRLIDWFGKEYIQERMIFIDYLIKTDLSRNKEIFDFIVGRRKDNKEQQRQLMELINQLDNVS